MKRGLQLVLVVLGLVAITFGAIGMLFGGGQLRGVSEIDPSVDGELRFLYAWYAAAGIALLRAARRPQSEGWTIRLLAAAAGIGGIARLYSIVAIGEPHAVFVVLTGIELLVPMVVIPWQSLVSRQETPVPHE